MHSSPLCGHHRSPKFVTAAAWLLILLHAAAAPGAGPEEIVLGALPKSVPGLNPGQLLLSELGCVTCHQATEAVRTRLSPRVAPRLGPEGLSLTPQFLRAHLGDPQSQKPGSLMPNLLHGMEPTEKAETVDALVHFLASAQRTNDAPGVAANDFLIQQGRLLYHQVGCVACHAPQEPAAALRQSAPAEEPAPAPVAAAATPALTQSAVPFGALARKTTVPELAAFLVNPLKSRPSGRMPSLNLTAGEATAIAVYLLREQAGLGNPARPPARVAGLEYAYFEKPFRRAAQIDEAKPAATGVAPRFDLAPRKRDQNIGFRFTGQLRVPAAGTYTFITASDDGSQLFIDGRQVVDNDGEHGTEERKGSLELSAGDHAIMVLWFNLGGPAELRVLWEGPGLPRQEIPAAALSHFGAPMHPLDPEELAVAPAKAARGRELFSSLGCAACHQVAGLNPAPARPARPLAELKPDSANGCLSQNPATGVPRYALSPAQRLALRQALARQTTLAEPLPPAQALAQTLAQFNCYACHSRDGIGGPAPERNPYFTTIDNADLGDEGRLPPHLNGVGAKLRTDWLRQVLFQRGVARPYMATRMPQFGQGNLAHLPELLLQTDLPATAPETVAEPDAKHGRKLVGAGGLSCISCHTFGEFKSLGIPAMDLTLMSKRLRKDWFVRYLTEPAALRPGTRMPNFWPDGQAANRDILGGDRRRQIEAIWAFLSRSREGGIPAGLVQGKMELVVGEEAVLYRHWIAGSGARAIAVGYPEHVNLSFNAEEIRLALLWQGAFLDAAQHRSGRGAGFVGPLGHNVIKLPPGPAFALLSDPAAPWPKSVGREGGFQLRGYRLDDRRRPAFLYSFQDLQIEDYFLDLPGDLDGVFRRTLTVTGAVSASPLWFRAWTGPSIEPQPTGGFLVDGKLTLRFGADPPPVLRRSEGQQELLVPVRLVDGKATLIEEILW